MLETFLKNITKYKGKSKYIICSLMRSPFGKLAQCIYM